MKLHLVPPRGRYSEQQYQAQADFRAALRQFARCSEQHARAEQITPQQHLVLLVTRGHRLYPRVSVGAIAEALQISPHGASLLVDRCVRRGLLDRVEDQEDRRRALISLTPNGQDILDRITEANRRELGKLDAIHFDESYRRTLVES